MRPRRVPRNHFLKIVLVPGRENRFNEAEARASESLAFGAFWKLTEELLQ